VNDACRHDTVRHDENRVLRSVDVEVLVHKPCDHISLFGTYLTWRFDIWDKGDFDEGPEKMNDAIVIVHATLHQLLLKIGNLHKADLLETKDL
jgi:hypothetical protein